MTVVELEPYWGPVTPQPATQPINGRIRLFGFSIRETSGAATAQLLITNQPNGGGLEMVSVNLNALEADRDWFGPNGLLLANGYFPTFTGAIAGSVFVKYVGEGGL